MHFQHQCPYFFLLPDRKCENKSVQCVILERERKKELDNLENMRPNFNEKNIWEPEVFPFAIQGQVSQWGMCSFKVVFTCSSSEIRLIRVQRQQENASKGCLGSSEVRSQERDVHRWTAPHATSDCRHSFCLWKALTLYIFNCIVGPNKLYPIVSD